LQCYKLIDNSESNRDLSEVVALIKEFIPFARKRLGFDKPVTIELATNPENGQNILGKTAFYSPESMHVVVYTDYRHPKDMLRSLSHELIHHTQNCKGEFEQGVDTGEGYAQKDGHMRDMEKEAYEKGNLCFRDWEDNYKHDLETNYSQAPMLNEQRNTELNRLLMKKFKLI